MGRTPYFVLLFCILTDANATSHSTSIKSVKQGKKTRGKKDFLNGFDASMQLYPQGKGKKRVTDSRYDISEDRESQQGEYDSEDLPRPPTISPTCIECDDLSKALKERSENDPVGLHNDQQLPITSPPPDENGPEPTIPNSDQDTEQDDDNKQTFSNIFNVSYEESSENENLLEKASRNYPVDNSDNVGGNSGAVELVDIANEATSSSNYYQESATFALYTILFATGFLFLSVNWS